MFINRRMNFKFMINLYSEIQFSNKKEKTSDRNNTGELCRH